MVLLAIGLWLVLVAGSVFAVRVNSLYQANIPVSTQTDIERNQLLPQALTQVLIKVSGDKDIANNPKIKPQLASVTNLVQQYGYSTASTGSKPYLLQIGFDPDGVNKLLRDAGAPIWEQNRPLIVVWVEYEAPSHPPQIIENDSKNSLFGLLKQHMDQRGLAVVFPAMDVTDMNQVSAKDVATQSIPILMNAAKRYESDAILIGRIIQDPTGYNTQWKLIMGGDQWNWTLPGKSINDPLTTLTDNIADLLAARYSTVVTEAVETQLTLKITGITQSDDIGQLIDYLKHLTPVADAQLVKVASGEVVLTVSLHGDVDAFTQALSVGKKLTPVPAAGTQDMSVYQWNH